tara:strand:+ start:1091 stop:1222 length:132 start_codon:yes stop_codon:yes gene_type:complete
MKIEINKSDRDYLYWLLRTEAYNTGSRSEDKKSIRELANKFRK